MLTKIVVRIWIWYHFDLISFWQFNFCQIGTLFTRIGNPSQRDHQDMSETAIQLGEKRDALVKIKTEWEELHLNTKLINSRQRKPVSPTGKFWLSLADSIVDKGSSWKRKCSLLNDSAFTGQLLIIAAVLTKHLNADAMLSECCCSPEWMLLTC